MAHRYFLTDIQDNTATVTGDEANHLLKVMRIKAGDIVILCDKVGFDYKSKAVCIGQETIEFEILEKTENPAQPKKNLRIYMALPKSDKLEFIVQKCCELGGGQIVPFVSEYCVAQKSKKEENKKQRLQKISDQAGKQCGRSTPLAVEDTLTFKQLLQDMEKNQLNLFFYENGGERLKDIDFNTAKSVGIIIGSEGGFSPKEAQLLQEKGAVTVGLGKRILRCETAAVAAVSLVMYSMGELE